MIRNTTPLLFATKACSRKPPRPEMTLIAKGVFGLRPGDPLTFVDGPDRGGLSGDLFHDDDDERTGECLYPSDFADYKLNAEVMLKGTCFAPGGKPVTETGVRFSVGAWSKLLRVIGPRRWTGATLGQRWTDPEPFTRMPLSYKNAFGGPEHPDNPVGLGFKTPQLPTIENPVELLRAPEDRPLPAGFGPTNPFSPRRAQKLGKAYGKRYVEERAPYYAEDFDWTYFSAAPPDQQISGYLKGDEEIGFQNLHAAATSFKVVLPGLRVRAFVKDDTGKIREVPMVLDTLFADLDKGQISLVWRGVDGVRESDLSDVTAILVTTEPLADPPGPAIDYHEALEDFERDPVGIDAARKELLRLHEQMPPGDPGTAVFKQALSPSPPPRQEMIQGLVGNVAEKLHPEDAKKLLEAAKAQAEAPDQPPVPLTGKPGVGPAIGLRRLMRTTVAQAEQAKAALAGARRAPTKEEQAKLEEIDRLPNDPRWAQMDPDYTPPFPLSTDAPGPYKKLADRDFTDQDLSGIDLSGADLNGAVLIRTKLRGAKLYGANLRGAVLFKADLTGADLGGADLTRANLAWAYAEKANFTSAVLEQTFFENAVLTSAVMTEAKGEYTVFAKADLRRVKAHRATFFRADFGEANIEEAEFLNASLVCCVFERCRGKKADLTGVKITAASFAQADLQGACLSQAQGERVWFAEANLDGANLGRARLTASHFTECSAVRAKLTAADLRESRFYKACLDDAEMDHTNLYSADLCKAKLSRVRFNGANLYDAKLVGASGKGADFNGANLKRSTLERA